MAKHIGILKNGGGVAILAVFKCLSTEKQLRRSEDVAFQIVTLLDRLKTNHRNHRLKSIIKSIDLSTLFGRPPAHKKPHEGGAAF